MALTRPFVLVVGVADELERPDGALAMLRQLGAYADAADIWDGLVESVERAALENRKLRAIVFDVGARPDLAVTALRALRQKRDLSLIPCILAVDPGQVARVEPSSGFDDFILTPCNPSELYSRLRLQEWRRSEFSTDERLKIGPLVIDRAAHDATADGRRVDLTAKEFALLSFFASHRGRVFTREALLSRVWGSSYEGGLRTVDIHVRRLRAKLGGDLPLETVRGAGYKLRAP